MLTTQVAYEIVAVMINGHRRTVQMAESTQAILVTPEGPLEVAQFLHESGARDLDIKLSGLDGFVWVNFIWEGQQRSVAMFYGGRCQGDIENIWPLPCVYTSMGNWGFSKDITMKMVKHFKGFYRMNDCADEWTEVK